MSQRSMTTILRFFLLVFAALVLGSCKVQPPKITEGFNTDGMLAADFAEIPQDLRYYAGKMNQTPLMSAEEQAIQSNRALSVFFSPWAQQAAKYDKDSAFWFVSTKDHSRGFIGQDVPFPAATWQDIYHNMDMEHYPSSFKTAITVQNASLRAMPTTLHYYLNPRRAGEGYPFDYLQLSSLWVGTPILITHTSLDGRWVLAESALTVGWLPVEHVAVTDTAFNVWWQEKQFYVITQDNVHFTTPQEQDAHLLAGRSPMLATASNDGYNMYALNTGTVAHIGTLLPQAVPFGQDAEITPLPSSICHLFLPTRLEDGSAGYVSAMVEWGEVRTYPLPATVMEVALVGNQMTGQAYGWGGIDELRDCSAMIHDLFLPFGIWLPRNSSKQALAGEIINLESMSPDKKEKLILGKGVPFFSLVYLPGHIGLYVGEYEGKALIFHNMWGVRLERELTDGAKQYGRAVIGRAVVTTLRPGVELPFAASPDGFLEKIQKLTVLPQQFQN